VIREALSAAVGVACIFGLLYIFMLVT